MASKSKSEQNTSFDPELKGAALDTYRKGQQVAALPYAPYDAATVAPMSPFQLEGMNRTVDVARAGMGQPQVQTAMTAAQNVAQFQPSQVIGGYVSKDFTPTNITSQGVNDKQMGMDRIGQLNQVGGVNAQQVGMANAVPTQNIGFDRVGQTGPVGTQQVQADRVNAGQFSQTNMNPYMNQYQQGVIDPAMRDIERARQMQQNENAASAVSAGAFGGSRQGLVEAETNRAALQQSADTAARLRQQGFESGANRAQADLNRSLQADTTSAQLGLQGNLANQRAGLQSGLQSQQLNTQRDLANQRSGLAANTEMARQGLQSGLAAQGQNTQRMLANQQADLRGQQLGQQAQQQNIQNELARQRANQGTRAQMEQAQMRADLQGQLANQSTNLQRQRFNQQAGMDANRMDYMQRAANLDRNMQGQLANQRAGLQGAAQNLAGAGMLGNLANQYRGMNFGDAQAITGVGQQQQQQGQRMLDDQYRRYLDARNFPLQMFDVLRGATGMLPSPVMQSGSSRGFGIG
jgi:hypothetical protein